MRQKYDWVKIKQEFMDSEYVDVFPFIEKTLGKSTAKNGNIASKTKSWGEEKKIVKEKEYEETKKQLRKEEIERLKIELTELLTAKKLSYTLLIKYLECQGKQVQGQSLTDDEKNFLMYFPAKKLDIINKWLQIELGLPTNIQELKTSGFFDNLVDEVEIKIKRINNETSTGRDNGAGKEFGGIPKRNKGSSK